MEDQKIIELYWNRSDQAITETQRKYGGLCYSIAYNILSDHQESEECVNDTWLRAWNGIPPQRPRSLSAFLSRIARNQALKLYERKNAEKRGGGQVPLALEELSGCIPDPMAITQVAEEGEVTKLLNEFLSRLSPQNRRIFLRRYWSLEPIRDIAAACGISESKAKVTLFRMRKKLKEFLEQEGIVL